MTSDIPEGWKEKRISEVTQILVSNVDKKIQTNEKFILLCNYMDVYLNRYLDSKHNFSIGTAKGREIRKFTLQKNDVIITKDSEVPDDIAVPCVITEDLEGLICGYHLAILRPNKNKIHGPFLMNLLQSGSVKSQFSNKANGITRYGLTIDTISNVNLTYPSLICEQQKIANILLTIDNTIEKTKELIEKHKMIKRGLMADLFCKKNWKKILLGKLVSLEYGKGLSEENRSGQGFPVYGSNGVVGYHFESLINERGIIVGRKGTAGAVSFSDRPFWPIDTTYYIKRKKELDLKFTYYLLSSLELEKLEASTGVPGLNRHDAYQIKAVDVPFGDQLKIASIITNIDYCIDSERNYLEKLIKTKTGLMQDLLTGKVRVITQ